MAEKKKRKKGPNLIVGRGEKRPASKGAGLTVKGRAKYNRETGSKLKPPVKVKPKNKKQVSIPSTPFWI